MAGAAKSASPYKVVEIADVTDARIEEALNHWSGKGYRFDSVHFVVQPGSRRPTMAFLFLMPAGAKGSAAR